MMESRTAAEKQAGGRGLIGELKLEHARILNTLNQVIEQGLASDQGRALLLSARELLLAHLDREDRAFYPTLRLEAMRDPGLAATLAGFDAEMGRIGPLAMAFFDDFAQGGDPVAFRREFDRVATALLNRIELEEDQLYRRYGSLFR